MSLKISRQEIITNARLSDLAALTAAGFSRANDNANYDDTRQHIINSDVITATCDEALVGFATFQRCLWR